MALDQELVGRSYPPSAVYEVGRGKIAEFATAIGAADPVHRDADAARAAGYPDVIAPPTFAIVLTLEAANVVLDDPAVVEGDVGVVEHHHGRFERQRDRERGRRDDVGVPGRPRAGRRPCRGRSPRRPRRRSGR